MLVFRDDLLECDVAWTSESRTGDVLDSAAPTCEDGGRWYGWAVKNPKHLDVEP